MNLAGIDPERRAVLRGIPAGAPRVQKIPFGVSGEEPEPFKVVREGLRKGNEASRRRKATKELLARANELLAEGFASYRVANEIGVTPTTVREWRKKGWVGAREARAR